MSLRTILEAGYNAERRTARTYATLRWTLGGHWELRVYDRSDTALLRSMAFDTIDEIVSSIHSGDWRRSQYKHA